MRAACADRPVCRFLVFGKATMPTNVAPDDLDRIQPVRKAGNHPLCHHRALEMPEPRAARRLVQIEPAPGAPFDHGVSRSSSRRTSHERA